MRFQGSARYALKSILLTLGSFIALFFASFVHAATLHGTVVGVSDGDTITVLDAKEHTHKIRLSGIDAPEKDQPYGQKSKDALSRLVFGKPVKVEWNKRDRYDRIVGQVWVQPHGCATCGLSQDACLTQLQTGLAWWFRKYATEQPVADRTAYEQAEADTRSRRVGLWQDRHPEPP